MFGSHDGRPENRSSTRAIDQSEQPRYVKGPTNMILALKARPTGTPFSLSSGPPPQSPTGGHQGMPRDQINATPARVQHNKTPEITDAKRIRRRKNVFGMSGGQLRRATRSQKNPGVTRTPAKTASARIAPPKPREQARKSRSMMGAAHSVSRAATRGLRVATVDARIGTKPAPTAKRTAPRVLSPMKVPPTTARTNVANSMHCRITSQLTIRSVRLK